MHHDNDDTLVDPKDNPYFSRTLKHLEKIDDEVPGEGVACRDCPMCTWYSTEKPREEDPMSRDTLYGFCAVLHRPIWPGAEKVRFCDGREAAILAMRRGS